MKHLPRTATSEEIEKLKEFIRTVKNTRTRDRARAILSRMQGASRASLAQFLGVHKDTVSNWITQYRKHGIQGLQDKPQKGNKYKLSREQKLQLKHIVLTHTPRQLGFELDYWDISILKILVEKLFQVHFKAEKSYQQLYNFIGFEKN
jgi:transposase